MAKILVVDDDHVAIGLMCLYLGKDQHDVTIAHSGKEALELFEKKSFDILITDIIMPEMDGYGLIMHLLLRTNIPKILAISAGAPSIGAEHILDKAQLLKVDAVLLKPLTYEDLSNTVNKLLTT